MSDQAGKDKRPGGPRIRVFIIIPQHDDDSLRQAVKYFIVGNIWSQSGPIFEGDWYRPIMANDPYLPIFRAADLPKDLRDVSSFVFDEHLFNNGPRETWDDQRTLDEILEQNPDHYVHTIYAYPNEDCEIFYENDDVAVPVSAVLNAIFNNFPLPDEHVRMLSADLAGNGYERAAKAVEEIWERLRMM